MLKDISVADIQMVVNNFNLELPEEHNISITVNDDGKLVMTWSSKTGHTS